MTTKTITITEEAYTVVKRLKNENESFSQLFLRLAENKTQIKNIIGLLKQLPDEGAAFAERVKNTREQMSKDMEEKIEHVRRRLYNTN